MTGLTTIERRTIKAPRRKPDETYTGWECANNYIHCHNTCLHFDVEYGTCDINAQRETPREKWSFDANEVPPLDMPVERVCLKKGYCTDFRDVNHPEQGNPWDIYIGRFHSYPNSHYRFHESEWHNPSTVKEYGQDGAIIRFREITAPTLDITKLVNIYKKYGRLRLGCWCKPDEECHGDVLKEYIEALETE